MFTHPGVLYQGLLLTVIYWDKKDRAKQTARCAKKEHEIPSATRLHLPETFPSDYGLAVIPFRRAGTLIGILKHCSRKELIFPIPYTKTLVLFCNCLLN